MVGAKGSAVSRGQGPGPREMQNPVAKEQKQMSMDKRLAGVGLRICKKLETHRGRGATCLESQAGSWVHILPAEP